MSLHVETWGVSGLANEVTEPVDLHDQSSKFHNFD